MKHGPAFVPVENAKAGQFFAEVFRILNSLVIVVEPTSLKILPIERDLKVKIEIAALGGRLGGCPAHTPPVGFQLFQRRAGYTNVTDIVIGEVDDGPSA
ncbi:hypothetical protein HORIV_31410 [Vreelandella olivaria]|uniref:Uncharacterized protein n=1 Tax=Vreelandella olivaria TaxID=390919 RepID=A0ABM7GJI3_9GAMM|nr:hypothetical protein HORIV_31410 [Halomonas olivaria]